MFCVCVRIEPAHGRLRLRGFQVPSSGHLLQSFPLFGQDHSPIGKPEHVDILVFYPDELTILLRFNLKSGAVPGIERGVELMEESMKKGTFPEHCGRQVLATSISPHGLSVEWLGISRFISGIQGANGRVFIIDIIRTGQVDGEIRSNPIHWGSPKSLTFFSAMPLLILLMIA